MMCGVDRRHFIASAAAAAGSSLVPARALAQAIAPQGQAKRILEIARREVARAGTAVWRSDIAGILDFGLHSALPRFHFANLEAGTVTSYRVAHGSGSDPDGDGWLKLFSNTPGSNATSRGAYITYEWYKGKYGTSIRLNGIDADNSNVLNRAIVMHPADYCTPAHVAQWGRCGRSNGCFAMDPQDFMFALTKLSGGRLLYADSLGIGPNGEHVAGPASPTPLRYA